MDAFSQLDFVLRILLAFALSGILGFERERVDKPAGLRTHILVGVGSCLFTVISFTAFPGGVRGWVGGLVVGGFGLLGGGFILQTRERVLGITTAASLWIAAAIGMAAGVGYYVLAVIVTALSYLTLKLRPLEKKLKISRRTS